MRGVAPRSRSHNSQTSGASRRSRQSWAGVTRTAANRARHGGLVPLRQLTIRHARLGISAARSVTVTRGVPAATPVVDVAGPAPRAARAAAGSACRERPSGPWTPPTRTASRRRCNARRRVALSPNSASPTTAVSSNPRGAHLSQQRERELPLRLKTDHGRGNPAPRPLRRRQPRLGQIHGRPQQPRLGAGPQRHRHRHLAVGNLARAHRSTGG